MRCSVWMSINCSTKSPSSHQSPISSKPLKIPMPSQSGDSIYPPFIGWKKWGNIIKRQWRRCGNWCWTWTPPIRHSNQHYRPAFSNIGWIAHGWSSFWHLLAGLGYIGCWQICFFLFVRRQSWWLAWPDRCRVSCCPFGRNCGIRRSPLWPSTLPTLAALPSFLNDTRGKSPPSVRCFDGMVRGFLSISWVGWALQQSTRSVMG